MVFFSIARQFANLQKLSLVEANDILTRESADLAQLLREVWQNRAGAPVPAPRAFPPPVANRMQAWVRAGIVYDHLIYAYMIENTRIYEIFDRVLREFRQGEKLEVPSVQGRAWLDATEDLFYKATPSFESWSLDSWARGDMRATRRNAYYRFFGMDLNHGADGGGPYAYAKAEAANREFVATFEELLREVWHGIENAANQIGPNTTDAEAIASLARRLSSMLTVRRLNGILAREEFFFVATMSWLHLTVEFDTPIVVDLRAQATSPEERLRKIGERVGLAPHAKSFSYFNVASDVSQILIELESGSFSNPNGARQLYVANGVYTVRMQSIINQWSMASGRDIKAGKVLVSSPRPLVIEQPAPAARVSPNGTMPVSSASR